MSDEEKTKEDDKQPDPLDEARKSRLEYQAENDRREAILAREEKLQVSRILGGETQAGQPSTQPAVSPERKLVNNALDFWKGTQLEHDIRKANE